MKALVRKELREVFGTAVVALVAYLLLVINLMGASIFPRVIASGTHEVPFVGGEFETIFLLVSVTFAAALGFRQSAGESSRGTFLFLLHRPVRRDFIFLSKLAVGGAVFVFCASMPILLYGAWAAIPGHHASPFEWSMSGSAWQQLLLSMLLYLGAFLSGLRPARWFGTRLLPLFAALGMFALLSELPLWPVAFPLELVLGAVLVCNVCYVGRVRDYA
jgi:ABC-type transport system involved in multi-copper enzyme maturation permease subunit